MKKALVILAVLFIVGCVKPIIIERNNTIYKNQTIYINRTIVINNSEECTQQECQEPENQSHAYLLSLIRRVSFLEGRQDKYWNNTECQWDLNKTMYERDRAIDELCLWNSSWC